MAEQGGLLSFLNSPTGMGLLSAVGAGLAGARRGQPINALGMGLMGGVQGYAQAQEAQQATAQREQQKKLLDMQMRQAQRGLDEQDSLKSLAKQFYQAPTMSMDQVNAAPGQAGPTVDRASLIPNTQPKFDTNGFINAYMAQDPIKAMQLRASMVKEMPFNKVDAKDYTPESIARFSQTQNYGDLVPRSKMEVASNGQVYDPYSVKPGSVFADPNKPFFVGQDGKPTANAPFQKFEINKAGAGAARTNVNVSTERSLLTEIAGGLGKQIESSVSAAQSAKGTLATLDRLDSALNSKKIITGPAANPSMFLMQIGNQMGIGGKDATETLRNTRAAIQAMAQLELDAAGQMKGQGQITEAERALLKRAAGGDITMTVPELKTLSAVSRKVATTRIQQHNQRVKPLLSNPNAASLAPFLTVDQGEAGGGVVDFGSLR